MNSGIIRSECRALQNTKISNTGTVAVDPNVRCYVDGVEAQIPSITTANWAVEPGETKDVPVTWYHQEDGAERKRNCSLASVVNQTKFQSN